MFCNACGKKTSRREYTMCRICTDWYYSKRNTYWLGKKHSVVVRIKLSEKIKASWAARKVKYGNEMGCQNPALAREKRSKSQKGKVLWWLPKQSNERKKKHSEFMKARMQQYPHTPEMIKKILKRREKSDLELKFELIIKKYNLPYIFVGNGEFTIGRKCPDFINLTKKIAVEVYYRKHKEKFRGGLDFWKTEREKLFQQHGWKLLFFDERLTAEYVLKELS